MPAFWKTSRAKMVVQRTADHTSLRPRFFGLRVSALLCMLVGVFTPVATHAQPIGKSGPCPTLTRYTPPEDWTVFPQEPAPTSLYPVGTVQSPLTPAQSVNCVQVPAGLKAQIVASEHTPGPGPALAYLMHFTFDERGRVWAVDTRDYPNTHNETGTTFENPPVDMARLTQGRSRVVLLTDINGDGALDNYKVFYTGLVIPTSIEVVKNGVIVTVPPYVVYLPKSATNPDTAGPPQVVVANMGSAGANFDSHFQTNSLTRGLDNWIYGHAGSNGCGAGRVGSNADVACGSGNIWRFKALAIGSDTNMFQIHSRSGPANAHGIGQMEDGQWFKSGATGTPHSNHQVRHNSTDQNSILTGTNNNAYYPITGDRYLWEGSTGTQAGTGWFLSTSTAASGHDFYTARLLPQKYWNRFAFVCEGSSKLCNQDSLVLNGSSWSALRMPGPVSSNIFASTDAWTAPLKARTGPEGGLYILDWYNYLFLHNPAQPVTNGGWHNVMRAKTRTRLYRIIPDNLITDPVLDLTGKTNAELVGTFWNKNFVWRLHAQRLLTERLYTDELGDLLEHVLRHHRTVDAVGIDGPVLHALWTLHGHKRLSIDSVRWNPILRDLMLHPAWTVRRNVMLALPPTAASYASVRAQCAVDDAHAHVRVQALENLTRLPAPAAGEDTIRSVEGLRGADTHITAAFTAAGTSKVVSMAGTSRPETCPAYASESTDSAGYPGTVVGTRTGLRNAPLVGSVRFEMRRGTLMPRATGGLPSGELAVSDLRGRVVFRSVYNKTTGTWSHPVSPRLPHPFYLHRFSGVDGRVAHGRLAISTED